ncbi:unnamed protein product, partial [Mesorhabditis belari]|uniref:CRAL-TRIO domain-containing protein n=1 Tax=Mesorhabditis belari TaxID=2138241 RepID=A0AAF3J223_9BILA
MTVNTQSHAATPASKEEKERIETLRQKLLENLPNGIPTDLDTDLNLLRWIRGYQENFDSITQNFVKYVSSRKAAGFSDADLPEKFFEMPKIASYLPFIASSRLQDQQWLEENNAFLFVERSWNQPKEFIKSMKTSDYLFHCFGYSEMLLQLILRREAKQTQNKGPIQFIVIFDLSSINIMDYLNPLSGHMKLWQLRSQLWQEWYPEMVQRIYLVHPPRALGLLWKLAKLFLNERNARLIEVISDLKELTQKHLPKWFVPKEFGGDFVNTMMPGDSSGVSVRRKILNEDHYTVNRHYSGKKVERLKPKKKDLSTGEQFIVPVAISENESILWDLTISGDIDFCVYRNQDHNDLVYPHFHLISSRLPEEGMFECLDAGEYNFCFHNRSDYFAVKLEYSISIEKAK